VVSSQQASSTQEGSSGTVPPLVILLGEDHAPSRMTEARVGMKAGAVALRFALAHNLMRTVALRDPAVS